MAGKDRTSYKSQVNTDLPSASTITAAEMRAHLQDELADNIRFRLDDADTQNKTSGAFSIDFDGVDQIITTITGTSGSTVTISNLEDGDVKYWVVNKSATETISFSSGTDLAPIQDYITAATKIIYRITYKNTTLLIEPLIQNIQPASFTTASLNANWAHQVGNNLKYRRNALNQVEIKGGASPTTTTNSPFDLPTGYRPSETRTCTIKKLDSSGNQYVSYNCYITTAGKIYYGSDGGALRTFPDGPHFFDIIFTLD